MKKITHILSKILFIDIETVTQKETYADLSEKEQALWDKKVKYFLLNDPESSPQSLYSEKAGIYAEFAKVVCISVGMYFYKNGNLDFRTKSFYGTNENELLNDFANLLEKHFYAPNTFYFCGHHIKEFDIPFLCRRMLIQGIHLPASLKIHGKKPWELSYLLDTLELWKFGDYKHYTSLDLLCHVFDVESPKKDMDGSCVHEYYYQNDLETIKQYCEADVEATSKLYQAMMQIELPMQNYSSLKIA